MSCAGRPELPLAVTMGEPAGVGGEIAMKAWLDRGRSKIPSFFVIDDPKRIRAAAVALGIEVPLMEIDTPEATHDFFRKAFPILPAPAGRHGCSGPSKPASC